MSLKNLMLWFWSTLLLGGLSSLLIGLVMNWFTETSLFHSYLQMILSGLTFGAVAILGFFAYLVFNWLCLGFLRNNKWFVLVQFLLLLLVVGNLIYLNIDKFSGGELWTHLLVPFLVLLASAGIATLKAKWTSKKSWIPTYFFMVVATLIEAIPSINPRAGELPIAFIIFTVSVLFICNAWQILQLHRWTKQKKARGDV